MSVKKSNIGDLSVKLLGSAAALALMTGVAHAAPQSADDSTTVVVTAQKREQRLQDVPIVVTTLSGKILQEAGVRDIKDMQILTPGLTVTSTQNESVTTARIRGVGTVGDNPGLESSVGVVIDGVYRPRNGVGFEDLGEMERIEVLKGPQGTLFGKNTSAGVINVITKKPQFVFGFEGEATVGSYGQQGLAASVTGPLVEDLLAGRLYVASRKRDGYYDVNTGVGPRTTTDDNDQDYTTVRAQLLATPNENMEFRLIADYSHRTEHCCAAVQLRSGPTAAIINALTSNRGIAATAHPEDRLSYANRDTPQVIHDGGVSVESNIKLDWFGGSTLTTVTGIRDWTSTNGMDIDYTGADILYRNGNGEYDTRFKTLSHEVRLAGGNDRVNWLVGAFYADETLDRVDSYTFGAHYEPYLGLVLSSGTDAALVSKLTGRTFGTTFRAGEGARDTYKQKSESWALFTNNSIKVTDALEVTVGLRYTSESKELTGLTYNTDSGAGCAAGLTRNATNQLPWSAMSASARQTAAALLCLPWSNVYQHNRNIAESKSDSNVSGTVKVAYHVNDNVMVYGSYAKGYKAGGYNLDRAQTGVTPDASLWFAPETVESYELGFKSVLFNKAVTLNATYFDQQYTDFQLNTFAGTAFTVVTIPELSSKGVDVDLYWKTPIKGLTVQGGVAYADTVYGNFTAAQLSKPASYPALSLLPGNTMSFAPKMTASTAISWTGEMFGLRTGVNLTAKYTDDYNTGSDLLPMKTQEAFTLVNGRLSFGAPNRNWTVEIWGQNLTDEDYLQVAFNAPLQGSAMQSTLQTAGSHPGTYYNSALDSQTYNAYLGTPRTYGVTLRIKY